MTSAGRVSSCRLCNGTGLFNECPQSCDGSHTEDVLWTCICTGNTSPITAPTCPTCGESMEPVEDQIVSWACRCMNRPPGARHPAGW